MSSPETRGIRRAAIVGVGAVGSTTAFAMIQAGSASEVLLYDLDYRRAEGELWDLQHSLPFSDQHAMAVRVARLEEVQGCDLVIVTAGVAQKPGETRLDLVKRNVDVFGSFMPQLAAANPHGIFIIVTNPVDVMTRVAMRMSGLPGRRVFGSGTMLDTARFRQLISEHCRIAPRNVHAYVIGEHGDSEVLVWSRTTIGPFHVSEYCARNGIPFDMEDWARIGDDVRRAAYEIIERKGATHFAIGAGCARLAQALGRELSALHTLSRDLEGAYGLHGVCLSLPTLAGREGAIRQIELELSAGERAALLRSAEVLDGVYQELKLD